MRKLHMTKDMDYILRETFAAVAANGLAHFPYGAEFAAPYFDLLLEEFPSPWHKNANLDTSDQEWQQAIANYLVEQASDLEAGKQDRRIYAFQMLAACWITAQAEQLWLAHWPRPQPFTQHERRTYVNALIAYFDETNSGGIMTMYQIYMAESKDYTWDYYGLSATFNAATGRNVGIY